MDNNQKKKIWFSSDSKILYLDGRITNADYSNSYLTIGVNNNGFPGVFYNYNNTNYFKIWPTAENNCAISGKNGIIITSTTKNNIIAQFNTSSSGIYSGGGDITLEADKINLQDSGKSNTCIVQIFGGLKASYYNSTDEKWYVNLKVNRTSSGGTLSGTWTAQNPIDTQSDLNKKNSIGFINDSYEIFFDNLNPKIFKYNEGTSDRFHTGFIAQEVQQALDIANISTQNFAGLVIHCSNTDSELWCLRYEEFISLNTWQIQKLKTRVTELENEIKEIKQRYEI